MTNQTSDRSRVVSRIRVSAISPRLPIALLVATTTAFAQVTPPPPTPPAVDEEAIVLTPFTVNTSKDRGYQAENTLSGSRLNSSLNDTPASVSVFTKEFLQDVALTELRELVEYSVSATLNLNDTGAETNANAYVNATGLTRKIDIRGINSSQALDYFQSITPDDSYRIGRYDESRGPNGILFGISDVGGLINQTSKQAQTRRDSALLRYSFGTQHRNRSEMDANKVIVKDKLALLVAGLHQENGGWQTHDFQDRNRIYGAVVFRPTRNLVFNAMAETGRDRSAVVVPFTPGDEVLAWYDNRQARGAGAVTFVPTNAAASTAAQLLLGITTRNANFTGAGIKRITFINNDATVFNAAGTLLTGSYNNPAVRHPDGSPGVSGTQLRLNDPSLVPYEVNAGGPGMYRDQKLQNYTITADWQVTKNFFVNFARNYQWTSAQVFFVNMGNPILRGDPNTTLGPRIATPATNPPPNPFAGRLYFDANWKLDYHDAKHEENRLSLSYQLDTRRFGTHRFAAMASRADDTDMRLGTWLALAGAPFSPDAENVNNRVTTRYYVTEGSADSFVLGDWRQVPTRITADGVGYDIGFVNQGPGNQNALAEQQVDSLLGVVQSSFFKNRLITTLGYREDDAEIVSFGHAFHPTLKMAVIDKDPAKAVTNNTRAIARSQGVVWHVLKNLSLLANTSTSIALPDFRRRVLPLSKVADPAKGKGEDIGISVSLFDRRLTAKAVYFTTSERGSSTAGQAVFADTNRRIIDAFSTALVGAGRPLTTAEFATRSAGLTPDISGVLFDMESKGYEFSLTANPTPNWRVTLNYGYTDRLRTNSFNRDVIPWYGFKREGSTVKQGVTQNANGTFTLDPSAYESSGTVAKWIGFSQLAPTANVSTLTTLNGLTVAQEIFNLVETMNTEIRENEQRWGLRPHRANMFTAYDFTTGRLKGFTIGGGYRWRSPNIIGDTSGGPEREGRAITAADLLLRYKRRLSEGRFRGTLSFQVNVMNLFDEGGIIPTHVSSTTNFQVPGGRGIGYSRFALVAPRSIRFTTSYEF
jgi:iron complex outermembrane recepter protein